MKKDNTPTNATNEENFMDKVKNGLGKVVNGVKNFFTKTARVNGSNCYGIIENIGDLLVYDDHALISAVGMDDIVFTNKNVVSYSFVGLGRIRRNKATVQYKIELDDNVVFPEKVRQKNDVKNLTATINIEKERSHFLGNGQVKFDDCDVYEYPNCFVLVFNLQRRVNDKVEHYQESAMYSYNDIISVTEGKNKTFIVKFNDKKVPELLFTPKDDAAYDFVKKLENPQ